MQYNTIQENKWVTQQRSSAKNFDLNKYLLDDWRSRQQTKVLPPNLIFFIAPRRNNSGWKLVKIIHVSENFLSSLKSQNCTDRPTEIMDNQIQNKIFWQAQQETR